MSGRQSEAQRMMREAVRIERRVARLKSRLVPIEAVAQRVADIRALGDRVDAIAAAAAPQIRECGTDEGREAVIRAALAPLLAEIERLAREPLPTLASVTKRGRP